MFRAQHAAISLLAVTGIVLLAACSDDTTAKPQVIFSGNTTAGDGDCRDSGLLFEVGDFGNPNANPKQPSVSVSDNSPAGQGTASVTCSVKSNGTDSFAVNATVVESGATGGLFEVDGTFKTTGEQANIHVVASSDKTANKYNSTDCVVAVYTGTQGVAAGRVWGTISCPHGKNLADDNRSCVINAEFRFENCAQ